MKTPINWEDYADVNRRELPFSPEDDIKSDMFAIMDELDKHYTMIRESSII
jgi:hypothetical protein